MLFLIKKMRFDMIVINFVVLVVILQVPIVFLLENIRVGLKYCFCFVLCYKDYILFRR